MSDELIGPFPSDARESAREFFRAIQVEDAADEDGPEDAADEDGPEPPLFRDEDNAWRCPYCDETGGEPLQLEGRPMSRWYNGEEGDPGCEGFDGCTLCDPRKAALKREAAEIAAFYGNGNGDVEF